MWICPNCQHTDKHIPSERDDGAKVHKCQHCPRCRKFRESLTPPLPPGMATEMWRLQAPEDLE